jgi:hypothetical protein
MGDTVNSMVQSAIQVTQDYTQICTSTNTQANSIIKVTGCNLSDDTILVNSTAVVSLTCIQNNSIQNSITNSIQQNIQQQAQAITASFGFPSITDAENFLTASLALGTAISQAFTNQCGVTGTFSSSTFDCSGSTIKGTIIEVNSYTNVSANCIQTNDSVNDAVNNAVLKLQQSSLAQQTDTFAALIYGFVLLLAVFGWLAIRFAETPVVQIAIVVIILISVITTIIYAATAKTRGNYPYQKAQ